MKSLPGALAVFFCLTVFVTFSVRAQPPAVATNAPVAGPLAGLVRLAMKLGIEDDLPARLSGLLWPGPGASQKCAVKKISLAAKGGGRFFILRTDNQNIVLLHFTETKPDNDSRIRREFYYCTTSQGDLALALSATFQFAKDDVDNELLKKVTWQTYGTAAGDGSKPLPITADIRTQFEAEKKIWLGQENQLKKLERKAAR